jgi:hypothetical protein
MGRGWEVDLLATAPLGDHEAHLFELPEGLTPDPNAPHAHPERASPDGGRARPPCVTLWSGVAYRA